MMDCFLFIEVIILLEGSGTVSWEETYYRTVMTGPGQISVESYTLPYFSVEYYTLQRLLLAGDGTTFTTLEPGTLVYPFQFKLPTDLPSSFTFGYGTVSYALKVKLKRPLLKRNIRSSMSLTVNGILDLNLSPTAVSPQKIKDSKGSNFCVCRKGKISFILELSRSGYVPGEMLEFIAQVDNKSNKLVNLKGSLVQVCTFYAKKRMKTVTGCVCEVNGPVVDKGDNEMWEAQPGLRIPAVYPTGLAGNCSIIDVQYFFELTVMISGLSKNITGRLPVLIGTVPLKSAMDKLDRCDRYRPQIRATFGAFNFGGDYFAGF